MANLAQLCIGTELPNLFKSPLFDSPLLHLMTFAKFRLYDMYLYKPDESEAYVSTMVAVLLLCNVGLFSYHLAVYFRNRVQGATFTKINNHCLSLVYFARPALLLYFKPSNPSAIIVNMLLATTANTFYSDESHVNFIFYSLSLHYVKAFEIFDFVQHDLFLWSATIYLQTLLCLLKIKYYKYFTNVNEAHYFTFIGTSWNFFCVFWTMSDPSHMWKGSLQLFAWFTVTYFESFGVLTPLMGQSIMLGHFLSMLLSNQSVTDLLAEDSNRLILNTTQTYKL
jgi:hypothetical protein